VPAIDPISREAWIAGIIPVVIVFGVLVVSYRRFRLASTAYVSMAFWQTFGGYYSLANVPFAGPTR
jgi:putative membrane protein